MEEVVGIKLDSFPILGLKKKADILEYDGPILSHFVDDFQDNYLYYWVDFDRDFNRWLIWKTTENQILTYLSGESSLKELLLADNKDFIYSVDIDENLNYHNLSLVNKHLLPERYIPEDNSYYLLEPDELYLKSLSPDLFRSFEDDSYVNILQKQAVFFKMEPRAPKFGTTVSFKDAADFFKNMSTSFVEFYRYFFYNDFKNKYITPKALNSAINEFMETITPRIAYSKMGSLEIGLGIDSLHAADKKMKEWQFERLQEFKHDVIDIDLNQEENLALIEEKYPIEIRGKIFKPIIELRNNRSFIIKVSNTPTAYRNKLSAIAEKSKSRLIAKSELDAVEEREETEFVVVYLEVPKNKSLKDLKSKEIASGMLFSEPTDHISIPMVEIRGSKIVIKLKEPIYVDVVNQNNRYDLRVKGTDIAHVADDREAGLNLITKQLINIFNNQGFDAFNEQFSVDSIDVLK